MAESLYEPPSLYEDMNLSPFNATKVIQNRDPKLIRLQQVEHRISSFNTMRIYIALIFLIITLRLFIDLFQLRSAIPLSILMITTIQIIGYAYGFQAHTSRSRIQAQIFFFYVLLSFGIIVYFAYWAIKDKDWVLFGEDMANIVLNILLLVSCNQYINLLKERDNLRKTIRDSTESQPEFP